ncbi:hypothetical protein VKT23_009458 [Stygiomarasmius scandens]|uniref:Anaphase-promoting complex subunit 4-like WD40 domain-containing protein n=1 Tax=Marasmiellus scandens TaxID=2682957 RepID=A0ABR1JGE1_9AGAR
MFQYFNRSYKNFATLAGPRDAINSVAFAVDGSFVSAAGYGGVTIWDLESSTVVTAPHLPYEPHNAQHMYFSSSWMYFEGTSQHVFIVGNMSGQISLWCFDKAQKAFRTAGNQLVDKSGRSIVMSIDVSEPSVAPGHSGRIVTSTDDATIAVWILTSAFELSNVFKIDPPENFIPRIVKFSRNTRNVFSFSKTGGGFLQLRGEDGDYSWSKQDGPKEMHYVAVDEKHDYFVAWTSRCAELYRLSNSEYVKALQGEVPLIGNTKQLSFAEDGSRLVVGTDHGFVEVFSVETGKIIQRLEYPRKSLVQYVATQTLPTCHLVAIAGSTKSQPADVVVFKKKYRGPKSLPTEGADANLILSVPITWTGIRWIGHILILIVSTHIMLNRYSQAFVWHAEASLYPLGLAFQVFIFVPALSKFASAPTTFGPPDTATVTIIEPAITVTLTEQTYSTLTVTEATPPSAPAFVTVTRTITQPYPVTATVTEKLLSIATVTESLTVTAVAEDPSSATLTSKQSVAEVGL